MAEIEREEAQVCLERLCKEARCTEFDDLPEAERRSQRYARLEADLATCEEQLLARRRGDRSHCVSPTQVEQADPDALDAIDRRTRGRIAVQEEELRHSTRPSAPSGVNWPAWTAATRAASPPKKRRRSWPGFKETSPGMQPSNWLRL